MNVAYYNGNFMSLGDIRIPLTDRALFFGDGIYEAILCINGRMHLGFEHLERFYNNLSLLGWNFDMSRDSLYRLLSEALKIAEEEHSILYFQLSRYAEKRIHACPESQKYNFLITVTSAFPPSADKKLKLTTYRDLRYFYCNIKTLNLLPAVIASEYAERNGCDECVLHRNGTVTECAHSNISIIKDGILYTHPNCELILPGTVRALLLKKCKELKIPYREEAFSLDDLYSADCVLVTSSTKLCNAAEYVDGVRIPGCDEGEYLIKSVFDDFEKCVK